MTIVLQGSLRHFPPWQLLPFLVCSVESATLEVSGAAPVRLVLRGGRAVAGQSAEGNDVVSAAAAMLSAEGTFTVTDAVDIPAGVSLVEMEIGDLLEEAAKYAREMARFADDVVFRVVDDPALQEKISMTADEFRLVFKIGTGRSVAELLQAMPMTRTQLAAMLNDLEAHGLIARSEGGGESVAAPPAVIEEDPDKTMIESVSPWLPLKSAEVPAPPAAAAPPPPAKARRKSGSLTADAPDGTVYALVDDEYTIGREGSNSIVIVDGSVSSKHAAISRGAEGWSVKDLGSRNGTFVNGEQVKSKESRLLADNDVLRLGKVILTFNVAGDMGPAETTERGGTLFTG